MLNKFELAYKRVLEGHYKSLEDLRIFKDGKITGLN